MASLPPSPVCGAACFKPPLSSSLVLCSALQMPALALQAQERLEHLRLDRTATLVGCLAVPRPNQVQVFITSWNYLCSQELLYQWHRKPTFLLKVAVSVMPTLNFNTRNSWFPHSLQGIHILVILLLKSYPSMTNVLHYKSAAFLPSVQII